MTPEQALDILDQAAAAAPLSRQGHMAAIRAVAVLRQALQPKAQERGDGRDGGGPDEAEETGD